MKPSLPISLRLSCGLLFVLGLLTFPGVHRPLLRAQTPTADPSLTVHEWGTFTSIAGTDGQAVEWLPLTGSTDLPWFVEHFRSAGFKSGLRGTVRMETPVLYFYSPHDLTVSVQVAFAKGLITEWYPHASQVTPDAAVGDASLYQKRGDGSISWDSVRLQPGNNAVFPRETRDNGNHYYAARETGATPLRVQTPAGDQQEKFLFYRGVSVFHVPVAATFAADGKLVVKNLTKAEIPNVVLFERRGEKVGYRISGSLQNEVALAPPELTSTVESLYGDLEEILVARGLYRDEAHSMLETWRNSWFEEGSRVFYIVPPGFVDFILPLSIHPAPAQTVRVFVGRLEVVSPATEKAVRVALAKHDEVTLGKYSRFLEPIMAMIKAKDTAQARRLGIANARAVR
ncbi:MAG: hypothetical protein ACHP79_03555 [Terriglobales bacterium]